MKSHRIPQRGDVYWIDPNPVAGKEIKGRHRFVVITLREINTLGLVMTVPVTSAGKFAKNMGLAVEILGHDTKGLAVCNQVRTFDIAARERDGSARYIETLSTHLADEIVAHVVSVIDPA